MVRPELSVIIVLADCVNLIFGFDRPMFGNTDIGPDSRSIDLFKVDFGIPQGLIGAVDGNRAGPSPAPTVFSGLVFLFVKVTNTRQHGPHEPSFDCRDTGHSGEKVLTKLVRCGSVWGSQAHARDDNTILFRHSSLPEIGIPRIAQPERRVPIFIAGMANRTSLVESPPNGSRHLCTDFPGGIGQVIGGDKLGNGGLLKKRPRPIHIGPLQPDYYGDVETDILGGQN